MYIDLIVRQEEYSAVCLDEGNNVFALVTDVWWTRRQYGIIHHSSANTGRNGTEKIVRGVGN